MVVHGRRTAIGKAKRGGFKVSAGYLPTVAKVRPEKPRSLLYGRFYGDFHWF